MRKVQGKETGIYRFDAGIITPAELAADRDDADPTVDGVLAMHAEECEQNITSRIGTRLWRKNRRTLFKHCDSARQSPLPPAVRRVLAKLADDGQREVVFDSVHALWIIDTVREATAAGDNEQAILTAMLLGEWMHRLWIRTSGAERAAGKHAASKAGGGKGGSTRAQRYQRVYAELQNEIDKLRAGRHPFSYDAACARVVSQYKTAKGPDGKPLHISLEAVKRNCVNRRSRRSSK